MLKKKKCKIYTEEEFLELFPLLKKIK